MGNRGKYLFAAVIASIVISIVALVIAWNNKIPTVSAVLPSPSCTPSFNSSPSASPSVSSESSPATRPSESTSTQIPGPIGPSGATGATGSTGAVGPAGTNGVDGDCSAIPYTSLSSDLIPAKDNYYSLGSPGFRWKSLHLGPGTIFMEDISTGLQSALTIFSGTLLLDGIESLAIGNMRITPNGLTSQVSSQDIRIGNIGDTGFLAPSRGIKFPDGTTQETATLVGPRGATGPGGGFGYYGNFYDTGTHALTSATATPIPLNSTSFNNGISIVDGYKITFTNSGKYNIAFSSQLYNSANQRRVATIWLAKNGITSDKWVAESATDLYIGTSVDSERKVAAWNFFVDVAANDYFVLLISVDGNNVSVYGGLSDQTIPASIPAIPSTILTVNQIG